MIDRYGRLICACGQRYGRMRSHRDDCPQAACLNEEHPGAVTVGGTHHSFGCVCGLPTDHTGEHCCNLPNLIGCGAIWS